MSIRRPSRLNERRKPVNGARVLVLGLAYKKNTSDVRETPAREVILGLLELDQRSKEIFWMQKNDRCPVRAFGGLACPKDTRTLGE